MSSKTRDLYEFGPFRIDPDQRLLTRDHSPVPLQPKAFDTLLALVRNSQRLILKEDLMKTVWPDTFVEESNLTQNVFVLRKTLGEAPEGRRYIVTVPGRGYRFVEKVRTITEPEATEKAVGTPPEIPPAPPPAIEEKSAEQSTEKIAVPTAGRRMRWKLLAAGAVAVLALAAGIYRYLPRPSWLTGKSTIVLADFTNRTGDPIFDGALRQGLSAQLEQSPHLNLLSDRRIAQTLTLMAQPKDAFLTPALSRDICQRTGSAAVLDASISQTGTRYLLTLQATGCGDGESLAGAEAQAADKNHVLDALGKIASQMRAKLGESLASLRQYDAPPQERHHTFARSAKSL